MTALTIEQLYAQQVRSRSPQERLRLLKLLVNDLTEEDITKVDVAEAKPKGSLLDLEGLGADDLIGMDAQEYVNQLRDEWDHRP